MQAISSILSPRTTAKKTLNRKVYKQGEVVRIHSDPPPKMKYITKWRNPFEEKGEVVDILENNHYRIKSLKSGKVTREHATRLNTCLYFSAC